MDRPVGGANQELEEIPSKGDAPAPEGKHEDDQGGTGMSKPQQTQILQNRQC